MDLNNIKTVYFIGIKGVGMSGLAIIAKERGLEVFGSDTDEHFITDETLQKAGMSYFTSFNESNIEKSLKDKPIDSVLVVVTAAHQGMNNVEAVEAKKRGFTVLTYGEALGLFMSDKKGISVAGTHGKTTTTSLLSHLLSKAGKDPSYLVGTSSVPSLGCAAHWGAGEYFIAEADEYVADVEFLRKPKFLFQHPNIAVITSVDWDHPDVFSSQEDVEEAFISFVNGMPANGVVIVDGDNEGVRSIVPRLKRTVITYGMDKHAGAHISNLKASDKGMQFTLTNQKKSYEAEVSLSGNHNVKNAVAALIASSFTGTPVEDLLPHLLTFEGSKRRFEKVGEIGSLLLFDDYAHHPEEIKATLSAFRLKFPDRRLFVLFQPHTFSRTLALLSEFGSSFSDADVVGITDIFASSREAYNPAVTGELVAQKVREAGKEAYFVENAEEFMAKIGSKLQGNDILITMGAGDIYTWHDYFMKALKHENK